MHGIGPVVERVARHRGAVLVDVQDLAVVAVQVLRAQGERVGEAGVGAVAVAQVQGAVRGEQDVADGVAAAVGRDAVRTDRLGAARRRADAAQDDGLAARQRDVRVRGIRGDPGESGRFGPVSLVLPVFSNT
jgi:hypothetical protein